MAESVNAGTKNENGFLIGLEGNTFLSVKPLLPWRLHLIFHGEEKRRRKDWLSFQSIQARMSERTRRNWGTKLKM